MQNTKGVFSFALVKAVKERKDVAWRLLDGGTCGNSSLILFSLKWETRFLAESEVAEKGQLEV